MKTNHSVRRARRLRWPALLLGLLTAAAGARCSNCQGGGEAAAILEHVPQDSAFVLLVPQLAGAMGGAKGLFDQFRDQPPLSLLVTQRKAQLVKELGFDPEKPETLKTKGIDPQGGLAVSLDPAGELLTVIFKTTDAKAVESYLRETAKKSVGSDVVFKESKEGELKVTQLQRQGKDEVLASWTQTGGLAVLCPMAPAGKHLACLQRVVKPGKSMAGEAAFSKLRERVGEHQLLAYVNAASLKSALGQELDRQLAQADSPWKKEYLQDRKQTQDEMLGDLEAGALGLQLSGKGIQAKAFALLSKESLQKIRKLVGSKEKDTELTKLVGSEALALLRFSLAADQALERFKQEMKKADPETVKRHQEALALVDDLAPLAGGRYVLAVYPPDAGALKQALAGAGGPLSMLSAISALFVAQVQDQDQAKTALDKLQATLMEQQIPVKTSTVDKQTIYTITGSQEAPMASFTLSEKVLLAGNQARIINALKRIAGDGENILGAVKSPVAKRLLSGDDTFVFYLSVGKAIDWLRGAELPPEAKMIISSALTPLGKIQELVVGGEVTGEGIAGELQLLVGN